MCCIINVVVRSDIIKQLGGFRGLYRTNQFIHTSDHDCWLGLLQFTDLVYVDEPCFIMTQDMALEKTMKINFKKSTDFIYSLNKIKQDEFILYHHLGLGDFIVCNGMVNYLSNKFKKIYIPVVSEPYFKMIQYLYSENENVNIFKIKNDNRDSQVIKFASTFELPILKVGFTKVRKQPFNEAFYNQLDLPINFLFTL